MFGSVILDQWCVCTVRRSENSDRRTVHTHTHTPLVQNYAAKHRLSTRQTPNISETLRISVKYSWIAYDPKHVGVIIDNQHMHFFTFNSILVWNVNFNVKIHKILKGTLTCFDLNRSSSGSRSVPR